MPDSNILPPVEKHWALSWDTAMWVFVVVMATVLTYFGTMASVPAYRGGPSNEIGRRQGLNFITVFCARVVLSFAVFLPLILLACLIWPAFREDFTYRVTETENSRNPILWGIVITFVATIFFGRAYAMGLDAEATRHMSAIILIMCPLIYKCFFDKNATKQWNVQMIIGIGLLAFGGALLIDDDVRNP